MSYNDFKFRTNIAKDIFYQKYALTQADTWPERCRMIVEDVCGTMSGRRRRTLSVSECDFLTQMMIQQKFLPGGRYIYYAGRKAHYFNNCFLLRAEHDTREEWASLAQRATSCLMVGGGIGIDYSRIRAKGRAIGRTGGIASGPLSLMEMINEIGRNVMQGGSRRSAIYDSLNWRHDDATDLMALKDWDNQIIPGTGGLSVSDLKAADFNYRAPLDMTNVSLNYDDEFLDGLALPEVFVENVRRAMTNGEPGMSFNFGAKRNETLRNAPVVAKTNVLTSQGYVPVGNIVGVPVVLWTGKQWASATFTKTRNNDATVSVKMTGRREITCSLDHEFITKDSSRVRAVDLNKGLEILRSLPDMHLGGKDVDDAYLLAYVYGDGSFHQRYPRAEACFCGAKEALLPHCLKEGCTAKKDGRGILRVYYKNDDIFRARSKKIFPSEVFGWSYASRAKFVSGLLDADGYADGTSVRLGCKHKSFLKGLQLLCDTLGLSSSIQKGSVSGYTGTPTWSLQIRGNLKDVLSTHRLVAYRNCSDFAYKVVSVTRSNNEDVYCCDVGVEEHSFMAEGVIISNCCEVTSEDDSDVCNLGSINMGRINSIDEFLQIVDVASKFLVCGTLRADLPYDKVKEVREKNRRLGLGLMGVHEWMLRRGKLYGMDDELRDWMTVYRDESERSANEHCDRLYLNRPAGYRAIAPTGTIGTLA